jgi:hypothetical protein
MQLWSEITLYKQHHLMFKLATQKEKDDDVRPSEEEERKRKFLHVPHIILLNKH